MSWNEPDNKQRNSKNGPPDLDDFFDQLSSFFRGLFGGSKKPSGGLGGEDGMSIKWIVIASLGVAFLVWVIAGFLIIDQQERGVLFRLGRYEATLQPGLQWQPPFIDVVETVNITRIREMSAQGRMLTKDENILQASLLVQYRVIDPKTYLINLRRPELSLANALDGSLRHVVGASNMGWVLTDGRADVASRIQSRLQASLDNYKSGIEVIKVNIERTQAPSEVQDAFDDVIKAREDRQRFRNQAEAYANQIIPQARGLAKRTIAEAEGYKEQVVNLANGQAIRFEKLLVEYKKAPAVMRKRLYLDMSEQVMQNVTKIIIDGDKNNNITLLPLDKLLARTQGKKVVRDENLKKDQVPPPLNTQNDDRISQGRGAIRTQDIPVRRAL